MSTRPFSELRDSVMQTWDAETHQLNAQASAYFKSISKPERSVLAWTSESPYFSAEDDLYDDGECGCGCDE